MKETAYYSAPYWLAEEGDWIKSLLLFFDDVAILLLNYMRGRHRDADPSLAGPLEEQGVNLQGKVIRVLHLNLTRVREPDYGLWLGWFPVFGLLFLSVSNCF